MAALTFLEEHPLPMADPLQRYRDKRNFSATPEPQGGQPSGSGLHFVIQKHAARSLHYDFRLELDGTLKSWAVPKGPSLDPHERRMAVEVEDHPLDYARFEGTIPEGHYGAGQVIVWDNGTWQPEGDARSGLAAGKLKFTLHGHKLAGRWTLVRMRGRGNERQTPWLLIKEHDDAVRPASEYSVTEAEPGSVLSDAAIGEPGAARKTARKKPAAQPATRKTAAKSAAKTAAAKAAAAKPAARRARVPLPEALQPQLATLVDGVPPDGEWLYEMKFDGYRLLARVDGGEVKLFTRNGHDWTAKLRGVAKEVAQLGIDAAWLDGEIVVLDEQGVPSFQRLQNVFEQRRTQDILYYLFDAPFLDGQDLREQPLRERRRLLREHIEAADTLPHIRFSEDFAVEPSHLLHTACQMRMEGVIGKRADAPYATGRSKSWIKLKCKQRQEFVIGGWTDPQGSRTGLGALLLGVHDAAGALHYAGNVGTGFNQQSLADLSRQLEPLAADAAPFTELPRGIKGHWVKPELVAEVSFAEWTKDGRVRQAVFHGLRSDKPPQAIGVEQAVEPPRQSGSPAGRPAKKPAGAQAKAPPAAPAATTRSRPVKLPAGLRLTHADRVVDASTGITKQELAEYAARAASRLLPHLRARPVSLVRAPAGIGGELFFQKHDSGKIKGLLQLDPSFDPEHAPLMEIASTEALLNAVQFNVIEFHTWNATTAAIDQPDRMTFDLDPGEGVAWPQIAEGAQLVHALLDELGLQSLLKTSGGKGLHVVVPFKPSLGWDAVKSLSQRIVLHLAQTLPDRFVAKSGPKNRVGRIFVDYLRNGRGATTVAAWSPRARPGMGVSVPVGWDELASLTSGAHYHLRNVDERLLQPEAWAGASAAKKQGLANAMRILDFVPPAMK
ncbi:DNA ligase D [Aquincola sp. J276]|uniref:DNA ligase D n=1 Tax=Aquincola sp. J276 TaxID=2898432 RepID=UPI00287307F2|nr:DNA ligase D [Aquincola sp. J276]